uniref:NAC domain-containing protein n=1 Tax=Populus trichocarpa TaxID=3694 RepID=B9IC64_POPTR|eukprot:XP_002320092.2 protein NTM1-like 9 isoform X1 [Populus trichocarpa]
MTSSTVPFPSAPKGYGFHPTDEELINHFLKLKMMGGYDHEVAIIAEVNVCNSEPWELPGLSEIQSNDTVWYFFSPRNYKYSNRKQAKRTTKAGYWKLTGNDRIIRVLSTGEEIAKKKSLVFYKGRVPNIVRTNWIMHEYNPTFNFHNQILEPAFSSPPGLCVLVKYVQKDFVLCKLKKNSDDKLTCEEGGSSSNMASDFPNNVTEEDHLEAFLGVDGGYYN